MTAIKLSASSPFSATGLQVSPRTKATDRIRFQAEEEPVRVPGPDWILKWLFPLLTVLGTAAAMWFVVSDGWFQLFGFWAL